MCLQKFRLDAAIFGKPIKMMYSSKDNFLKDNEAVREMLTAVVRVQLSRSPVCLLSILPGMRHSAGCMCNQQSE
jgi:hypothetical protein